MYHYRFIHDVSVAFSDPPITPIPGEEIDSETPIDHPYLELIVSTPTEVPEPETSKQSTEEVTTIETPVTADLKGDDSDSLR